MTGPSRDSFEFFIKSREEGRLVCRKYRETSSRFSLWCFDINVYIFVLDKTAGFGCRHFIYRGYYTVARRYEFYVRVARTISQEWASERVRYCSCHENIKLAKIHIFEPTCNVLFIIWRLNIKYFRFYCVSK